VSFVLFIPVLCTWSHAYSAQEANVNVTANLLLNVYGLNPVNITLDLCNILGGALCPLPMYNFTGSSSVSLPNSLGVSGKIPGIAFKVPDLEGFAQLTLTEVITGNVKACVQATLSNGWSTHQPAVEWATGGAALAALLSAAWQSLSPEAILPFRLLDLIYLYQSIASSSYLSLNYPSSYRAFTLNFSWAMGLFSTSSSSSIQSSINRMRHLTGGKLADANTGSAVGFVNRKLSPYNIPSSNLLASPSLVPRVQAFDLAAITNSSFPGSPRSSQFFKTLASSQGVQTVTAASSNVLQAGIPIYVNSINIAIANAFMSVFICGLVLFASAAGVFLLAYAVLFAMGCLIDDRVSQKIPGRTYRSFIYAWCFRLVNLL
jgi:Transient receptor potential (TRP) ion channel/ML-like domain